MSPAAVAVSTETHTPAGVESSDEIQLIDVKQLRDHPANPPERVKPDAIAELVGLIQEFGQRDPVRVRIHGFTGRGAKQAAAHQILSGHRRVAACRKLKRDVRCEVVDCDDTEALKEVLFGNVGRKDLNAIQRAELLQSMITHGIDRAEAGRAFGLASTSGIKNTLRLLELPPAMRDLIADGSLPARSARYAIPFAEATVICERWAKQIAKERHSRQCATNNPSFFFKIETDRTHCVDCRPVDGKTKYDPGYEYEKAKRGFELDDKLRKRLQIVSIPIGPKGKMVEVAQNVKLFDKLNKPHLVKRSAYGSTRTIGGRPVGKNGKAKTLTPSQAAAEKKRKAAEADKRLKAALPKWKRRFQCCTLATHTPKGHPVIQATLPWMLSELGHDGKHWIEVACESLGCKVKGGVDWGNRDSMVASMIATCDSVASAELSDRLWRVLLWPCRADWPVGPIAKEFEKSAPVKDRARIAKDCPAKVPIQSDRKDFDDILSMMIRFADVSVAGAWRDGSAMGSVEYYVFSKFLLLHTTDQLDRLAKKWKVKLESGLSKGAKVSRLEEAHQAKKPLPLPEVLK